MSAVALFHSPMTDKNGAVITTALTNLDIHDIARSATTYGVEKYYIVHPLAGSRAIANRIIYHWQKTTGRFHNKDRATAIERIKLVESKEELLEDAHKLWENPTLWATDARQVEGVEQISYAEARIRFRRGVILAFGTGSGMTFDYLRTFHAVIEPIKRSQKMANLLMDSNADPGDYNHLSVRSAVAITLDRILGRED